MGGTLYNNRTLETFMELELDSQRGVKKLASKLHALSVNYTAKLVHTRRELYFQCHTELEMALPALSHQEPVSRS